MFIKDKNGELKVVSNPKGTQEVYRSTDFMDNNIQPNLEVYQLPQSNLPALKRHGSEELLVNGVFHGGEGEWVPPGVFHGGEGEWMPPGVFHGGFEELPPGTGRRCGNCGESIPEGIMYNTANEAGLLSRFVLGIQEAVNRIKGKPYTKIWYQTATGRYNFQFGFWWKHGFYEIDILMNPSFHPRSPDLRDTHRLPSARGGYMVCLDQPQIITNEQEACRYCAMWAEATARYIVTGQAF